MKQLLDSLWIAASIGVVALMSARAHAGGALRADGGGPSRPSLPPVTVIDFSQFDSALRGLQDYYTEQARKSARALRQAEEDQRYEAEAEERRRDAELEFERASQEATDRARELREAEEQALRDAEEGRRQQAAREELARRKAAEDAEQAAEEDERSANRERLFAEAARRRAHEEARQDAEDDVKALERARLYAKQTLEGLADTAVARTVVKDINVALDYLQQETQPDPVDEFGAGGLARLLQLHASVPTPDPLKQGVGDYVDSIFETAASEMEAPAKTTLGGWLSDQVSRGARRFVSSEVLDSLRQRMNEMLGASGCEFEGDGELTEACQETFRAFHPVNLTRGFWGYAKNYLKASLKFTGLALPHERYE